MWLNLRHLVVFLFQLIKNSVSVMSPWPQIAQCAAWPLYIFLRVLLPQVEERLSVMPQIFLHGRNMFKHLA